jgi:hypothetical protein
MYYTLTLHLANTTYHCPAENAATTRAIRYMQQSEKKLMKDDNYDELKEKKLSEECHLKQLNKDK